MDSSSPINPSNQRVEPFWGEHSFLKNLLILQKSQLDLLNNPMEQVPSKN